MVACGDGGGASFLTCAAEKCTRARERRAAPPFPRSCALGLQGGGPPPPVYAVISDLTRDRYCVWLASHKLSLGGWEQPLGS